MGYRKASWKFFNESLRLAGFMGQNEDLSNGRNKKFVGKKILEMGCQVIRHEVGKKLLYEGKIGKRGIAAKKYFKSIGFKYVSIDISGCEHSLKIDLRKPIDSKFYNKFDIVTNVGTSEHVLPLEGQYECFKNIHLCTKVKGIMMHLLPFPGKRHGHCQIFYTNEFFKTLARLNKYKLILSGEVYVINKYRLMGFCFIKLENNSFSQDKEEILRDIIFVNKIPPHSK